MPSDGGLVSITRPAGSIDLSSNAVLFCRLREPFVIELRRDCLNGVVNKLRIHKSARVNGPDTMLVFVSDLINEFAVF